MRYYSDKVNKIFETEEDLTAAEKEFDELQEKKEKEKNELIATRKEMAADIEKANLSIDEAMENYAKVYKEAEEILRKARAEAENLLKPAREQINEAQYAKYEKVKEFNRKYGPYSVSYTGEKAYNEFKRSTDWFNYMLKEFLYK